MSHGALKFMAYKELYEKGYSRYFGTPINTKTGKFFIQSLVVSHIDHNLR